MMRNMSTSSWNLFESIPESLDEELFSQIVHGDNVRKERIVSEGHISPEVGWHDQSENEWVLVLKGEARLLFKDGDDVLLVAGSQLNIPARTEHKVVWTTPDTQTVWLAVHYR